MDGGVACGPRSPWWFGPVLGHGSASEVVGGGGISDGQANRGSERNRSRPAMNAAVWR